MTDIRIKRLTLENFKCHAHLSLAFEGGNVSIYGDNATGKTSVYDAFYWLLFGKDSRGNGEKNIDIKPLNADGEVADHEAQTSVTAVLLVDGEELTLRRTYHEVWSTKRGSATATYDGNTSEYYVDGVPCKANAFKDKVNELVSEDTFRMLTSVSHFASQIGWQERRGVLFQLAGVMSDQHIMATDARFDVLAQSMGKLSIEEYKKKLLAEKKGFVGAKSDIPARISECEKTIEQTRDLDFEAAKAASKRLTAEKDALRVELLQLDHNSAADKKRLEIREAQMELNALERENRMHREEQRSGGTAVAELERRVKQLQGKLGTQKSVLSNERAYIAALDEKITASRSRWIAENKETFSATVCPTCGQNLPEKQVAAAQAQFEAGKQSRLREIEGVANAHKGAKTQAQDRATRIENEVEQLADALEAAQKEFDAAHKDTVTVTDMEGYTERRNAINAKIDALNADLADIASDSSAARAKLQEQIWELEKQISAQDVIAGKEWLLEYTKKRVEQLREDAANAAAGLEAIEKMLFALEEYNRYKTQFVESSINGLFRIARFRLFREQANGGLEERCDVVHDGVPYMSVNNGMKINLGIDIINTLSAFYGVRVPLFVDNAESVTSIEFCGSQLIRLAVSEKDKELRLEYELEN